MSFPEYPITRNELYLSNIAGEETTLPEYPVTREEQYLDFIAKNGAGGGGASSADDVSYDNTASGLTAEDVQGAIDEVVGIVGDVEAALQQIRGVTT